MSARPEDARSVPRRWIALSVLAVPLGALIVLAPEKGQARRERPVTPLAPAATRRPMLAPPETPRERPPAPRSEATPSPDPATVPVATVLLERAADPRLSSSQRADAIERLRRAPGIDAVAIERLGAIVADPALDADTRTRAIDLLHQLSGSRPDLEPWLGPALVAAVRNAPDDEARAFALETLSTASLSEGEVASIAAWLADANPRVRLAAARAAASSPLRDRALVAGALENALAAESDIEAAEALVDAALRVGRGQADTILARMERASVVRGDAALSRRIAGYRASLGAGETDPRRIIAERR